MGMRTERLRQDQTVISLARLHMLYRKEANHDGYLQASLAMGVKQRKRQELAKRARANNNIYEAAYHLGWLDCLGEHCSVVSDAIARQLEAHPHGVEMPRSVRKGQRCVADEPGCSCLVAIR